MSFYLLVLVLTSETIFSVHVPYGMELEGDAVNHTYHACAKITSYDEAVDLWEKANESLSEPGDQWEGTIYKVSIFGTEVYVSPTALTYADSLRVHQKRYD